MPKPTDHDKTALDDAAEMRSASSALAAVRTPVTKRLSLSEYAALFQASDRPTPQQIEAYVGFVSASHSWYKHLPMFPPGTPFQFFPHPLAGMDVVLLADARINVQERVGERGFHYSWMPTADYRGHFGLLSHHTSAGSSFLLGDGAIVNPLTPRPTFFTQHGPALLPEEVLEAGRVLCTGIIHPYTNMITYWTWHRAGPWREAEWPEECGGESLKQRIMQRIENPEEARFAIPASERKRATLRHERRCPGHGRLRDILAPERRRQTDAICNSIRAVCSIIWD